MLGTFITFEGGEGSGKSTLSKAVAAKLEEAGVDYVWTREPGGTPISEKIRDLLLDPENKEMRADTEALLYAASRAQHTYEKIIPALEEGKIVLCDRYIGSSFAYQGLARNRDWGDIAIINDFSLYGFRPDLEIVLDVDRDTALKRMTGRKLDRLEQEPEGFHELVRMGFQQQSAISPYSILLDGTKSLEELTKITLDLIIDVLEKKRDNFTLELLGGHKE